MAEAGVRCGGGSTSTCGRSVCRALVRERKGKWERLKSNGKVVDNSNNNIEMRNNHATVLMGMGKQ